MKECVFCRIVKGELPCYKFYEDDNYLAFLDISPSMKGQTLVIPKKHYSYFFDMENEVYNSLMLAVKKIARAIDKSLKPIKTGIIVEGFQVDHVHVRVYPLNQSFPLKPLELRPSEKEFKELARKIAKEF